MSSISFDVFTLELKLDAVGTPYRTVSLPSFYTFDKLHSMIVWLFQWRYDLYPNLENIDKTKKINKYEINKYEIKKQRRTPA